MITILSLLLLGHVVALLLLAIIVQRAPEEPKCPHGRYLSDCIACYSGHQIFADAADEEDSGRAVGAFILLAAALLAVAGAVLLIGRW